MYLHCPSCDVRQRNCRDWYKHLSSDRHQEVAKDSLKNCSSEMACRSVLCWELSKERMLQLRSDDCNLLISYFGSFGLVHDIYFKRSINDERTITACLVLMDSDGLAKNVVYELRNGIKEDTLQMRSIIGMTKRRCDVSGFIFQKAMQIAEEELFRQRHEELVRICENIPLEQQFYEFSCATTLCKKQIQAREDFFRELESVLRREFRNCKLRPYGSVLIGIGDKDADLDIFVDVGQNVQKLDEKGSDLPENAALSIDKVFDRALECIRENNDIRNITPREGGGRRCRRRFKSIVPIKTARVPIIRLIHEETELHCDLSFNSPLSIHNSNLMKFYIQFDPRVRPLVMFIRYWGRFHSLIGSNKIKAYALILMAIVFLNQVQILPSVQFLQEVYTGTPLILDGWNVAFEDNAERIHEYIRESGFSMRPCPEFLDYNHILTLARDFFTMFWKFNYEECFVCPLRGISVEKSLLQNEEAFQLENFSASFERLSNLKTKNPMCIQDPFMLDFNVTSAVSHKLLKRFTSFCKETATFLNTILTTKKGNLFSTLFIDVEAILSENTKKPSHVKPSSMITRLHPVISSSQEEDQVKLSLIIKDEFANPVIDMQTNAPFCNDIPDSIMIPLSSNSTYTFSLDLNLSKEFEELFMKVWSTVSTPEQLYTCMKITWTIYAADFFNLIFEKGFGLKVGITRLPSTHYSRIPGFNITEARSRTLLDVLPYRVMVIANDSNGRITNTILTLRRGNDNNVDNHLDMPNSSPEQQTPRKKPKMSKYPLDYAMNKNGSGNDVICEDDTKSDFQNYTNSAPTSSNTIDGQSTSSLLHKPPSPEQKEFNNIANVTDSACMPKLQMLTAFSVPLNIPGSQESYHKIPTGLRKPFSIKYEVQGQASGFIGRRRRVYANALFDQKVELLTINPLTMEAAATKAFTELNEKQLASRIMNVKFLCKAFFDTSTPLVHVHIEETIEHPGMQFAVVHLLRDIGFSQMFQQYVLFRLYRLLFKNK